MNNKILNHLTEIGEGIYQSNLEIVKISEHDINFIKEVAKTTPRKRARICAHQSNQHALHEMMIAICADSYIHPHRHIGKSESFHVIEGEVDVVVMSDNGGIKEVVELGDSKSNRNFYYRLSNAYFHTLIIKSDLLVVHEVTNGPFLPTETELASFAPQESESEAANEYMSSLMKQVYG